MVRMINKHFGNEMLVAEDRVKEYISAGHKLADIVSEPKAEKPKSKKTAKKK